MIVPAATTLLSTILELSLIITKGPCVKTKNKGSVSFKFDQKEKKKKQQTIIQFFPISTPFPILAASMILPGPIDTKSPILVG